MMMKPRDMFALLSIVFIAAKRSVAATCEAARVACLAAVRAPLCGEGLHPSVWQLVLCDVEKEEGVARGSVSAERAPVPAAGLAKGLAVKVDRHTAEPGEGVDRLATELIERGCRRAGGKDH